MTCALSCFNDFAGTVDSGNMGPLPIGVAPFYKFPVDRVEADRSIFDQHLFPARRRTRAFLQSKTIGHTRFVMDP